MESKEGKQEKKDYDQFEYLFQLPYELIVQIVSEFSLKETDLFCNQVAKEVEFGEGKLYLKEICNDIWHIKYIVKFGEPTMAVKNWYDAYMKSLQKEFIAENKKLITNMQNATTKSRKVEIIFQIFDYILENKELLQLKENKKFKDAILNKLFVTMSEIPEYEESLMKYVEDIYGTEPLANYLSQTKMLTQLFN